MDSKTQGKQKFSQYFDWPFFSLILVLCLLGLMTIYSSTSVNRIEIFYKQSIFMGIGLTLAFALSFVDYRFFERLAWPFYIFVILLLVAVMLFGREAAGSQRWLDLGVINLQPSELAKMAIVFVLARFYSHDRLPPMDGYGIRELLPVFGILIVPMVLIFLQPDLGTALMVAFIAFSIIYFCQLRIKSLILMMGVMTVAAPLAYNFVLKEYQRDRVRTFLDPQRDPLGEGYHSIQSMIAVGSGELVGKGYLKGSQSKLEFLPKHHTDFIFSAFAEEWGFVGGVIVLGLFGLLILMGVDIARKSKDRFGSILAMGAVSLIIWHVIVNIGMEIGLLPVVGVTLPFFSYGGSSMITCMMAVGILLSVSYRRHIF